MAWTNSDLKIFAAGLAIGGKWNGGGGKNDIDTVLIQDWVIGGEIQRYKGASTNDIDTVLIQDWVIGGVEVLE